MLQKLPARKKEYKFILINNNDKKNYIYIYIILFTLDSSAVSDKAGGSSKQKNSLTHAVPMRRGLLNIPLTNA